MAKKTLGVRLELATRVALERIADEKSDAVTQVSAAALARAYIIAGIEAHKRKAAVAVKLEAKGKRS